MFGWYDRVGNICLPMRVFAKKGWLYPIYYHEVTHWRLGNLTQYGIMEREFAYISLVAKSLNNAKLSKYFDEMLATMYSKSFNTQEGLAIYVQIQVASKSNIRNLSKEMINSVDTRYKNAYAIFENIISELQPEIPEKLKETIATLIGHIAFSPNLLLQINNDNYLNNNNPIETLINENSPDNRLLVIKKSIKELPPLVIQEWIDSYLAGRRPKFSDKIFDGISFSLLSDNILDYSIQFHKSIFRLINLSFPFEFKVNLSLISDIVGAINYTIVPTANIPEAFTQIRPSGVGSFQIYREDFPLEKWENTTIFTIYSNMIFATQNVYTKTPLDGIDIGPNEIMIEGHSDNRDTGMLITKDIDMLRNKLSKIKQGKQFIFALSSSYDFEKYDVAYDTPLLKDKLHYVLHLGDFYSLMLMWLNKCIIKGEKVRVFSLYSNMCERYVNEHKSIYTWKDGGFGYMLLRTKNKLSPIIIWPTPMFILEGILSNMTLEHGIEILKTDDFSFFDSFEMYQGISSFIENFEPKLGEELR